MIEISPNLPSKCHQLYHLNATELHHTGKTALAMAVAVEAAGEANFISGVMAFSRI